MALSLGYLLLFVVSDNFALRLDLFKKKKKSGAQRVMTQQCEWNLGTTHDIGKICDKGFECCSGSITQNKDKIT